MLTKITIRNFKRFATAEIELGNPVVFVGPNDSGKTSALQALTLWDIGLRRWSEKRRGTKSPEKRPGVAINRRDLTGVPVPAAKLLWRNLHLRDTGRDPEGRQRTENVLIDVIVAGVSEGTQWDCGLEFDFANDESIYCRPLRLPETQARMSVPDHALRNRVVLLGPMSGLAANEPKLEIGAINVRVGEGRTAEVLRNLCYLVLQSNDGDERWNRLAERMRALFGIEVLRPGLVTERGEIDMAYRDRRGNVLDLSAAGRGMQQTLLLLSFLALNSSAIVLLDEPDAHLEILRQRQTYQLLSDAATEQQSQVIIASHSEVILNEAADRDVVVAFVGQPHRIDDRSEMAQVAKALKEIGFQDYYQAELTGWVLYVEGPTDLAILRGLAERLEHPARARLERPFVRFVQDQPSEAQKHFFGLREAKPDLMGAALFDRLGQQLDDRRPLEQRMWQRREIENYICQPETLRNFAEASVAAEFGGPLFEAAERGRRRELMSKAISDRVPPVALRDPQDRFWIETKASTEFLDPLFAAFYKELDLPNLMSKTDYHRLVIYMPIEGIDPEVVSVLDWIVQVASRAAPEALE